jgi:hypothetical protein
MNGKIEKILVLPRVRIRMCRGSVASMCLINYLLRLSRVGSTLFRFVQKETLRERAPHGNDLQYPTVEMVARVRCQCICVY